MLKPSLDYILGQEVKKDSGIVKTSDREDTPQTYKVLAVGPGRFEFGEFIRPEVKEGDIVYIQKAAEADTPQELREAGLALFMASRIMGVL